MKSLIPWRKRQEVSVPAAWNDSWFASMWEQSMRHFLDPLVDRGLADIPSVDVTEDKSDVCVRVELPGMSEKEIDCTWRQGILSIRGEKKSKNDIKKHGNFYSECRYGCFSRDIPINRNVDWSKAKASYTRGVLTVKLPKREPDRKTIEVKIN